MLTISVKRDDDIACSGPEPAQQRYLVPIVSTQRKYSALRPCLTYSRSDVNRFVLTPVINKQNLVVQKCDLIQLAAENCRKLGKSIFFIKERHHN